VKKLKIFPHFQMIHKISKAAPKKLSLKYKIAISVAIIHLIFVLYAFYRDNKIFSDTESFCTMQTDGQVGMPFPLLMASDLYFTAPALFLTSATEELPRFIKYTGTGGPCTYTTINSALPYSLLFIAISTIVYYLLGLMLGEIISRIRNPSLIT
jgi:hypothetical protein